MDKTSFMGQTSFGIPLGFEYQCVALMHNGINVMEYF